MYTHVNPSRVWHVHGMYTRELPRPRAEEEDEHAPHACIHVCILSRVWHVHGMYAQVSFRGRAPSMGTGYAPAGPHRRFEGRHGATFAVRV